MGALVTAIDESELDDAVDGELDVVAVADESELVG